MDYKWRAERLREFEAKLSDSTHALYHRENSWAYIPRYPWGKMVAGLWRADDDVHELNVWTHDWDQCERDGLYACWLPWSPPFLKLVAVVDEQTISRDAYEFYMTRFWETILDDPDSFGAHLGGEFVHVGYARRERRHR